MYGPYLPYPLRVWWVDPGKVDSTPSYLSPFFQLRLQRQTTKQFTQEPLIMSKPSHTRLVMHPDSRSLSLISTFIWTLISVLKGKANMSWMNFHFILLFTISSPQRDLSSQQMTSTRNPQLLTPSVALTSSLYIWARRKTGARIAS